MSALAYILLISIAVLGVLRVLLPKDKKKLLGPREFTSALLLPYFGTLSPNYLVFALMLIGYIAIVPAEAEERLGLLVFSLPLVPVFPLLIDAPSPVHQLVRVDSQILLLLGCLPAVTSIASRTRARYVRWDTLMLLFLTVFIFISSRGTSSTNVLRETLQQILGIGLPYFIFSRLIGSTKRPADIFLALIFSGALVGALATFESIRNWLLYSGMDVGQDLASISGYAKQRGGFLRAQVTFPEPTSLSIYLALCLCSCLALRKEFVRKRVVWILCALIMSGLFFTFARVGTLMCAIALVGVLLFERRYSMVVVISALAPLLWFIMQVIGRASPTAAGMLGMGEDASSTVDYRRALNARIWQVIREHPILGVDQAQVPLLLSDLRQGEGIIDLVNTPLVIGMQAGIMGMVIFLLPTIVACGGLLTSRSRLDPIFRAIACLLFVTLISLNVALLTTSLGPRNSLWLILLIGASAGLLARRSLKKGDPQLATRKPGKAAAA